MLNRNLILFFYNTFIWDISLKNKQTDKQNYVIINVTMDFTNAEMLRKIHSAFSRQLYPMHAEATGVVASQTPVSDH